MYVIQQLYSGSILRVYLIATCIPFFRRQVLYSNSFWYIYILWLWILKALVEQLCRYKIYICSVSTLPLYLMTSLAQQILFLLTGMTYNWPVIDLPLTSSDIVISTVLTWIYSGKKCCIIMIIYQLKWIKCIWCTNLHGKK